MLAHFGWKNDRICFWCRFVLIFFMLTKLSLQTYSGKMLVCSIKASIFIRVSRHLQITSSGIISEKGIKFLPDPIMNARVTCPLSQKAYNWLCEQPRAFIFVLSFLKLKQYSLRQTVLNNLQIRYELTINARITCPLALKAQIWLCKQPILFIFV